MATDREAELIGHEGVGGSFHLLTFRHPTVAREAHAGQFVMMKAGRSAEPPLRRPFSILGTDPGHETFSLFVKAIGSGSRGITDVRVGETALCLGPLGQPFPAPASDREPLLVAGGYGVAPLLFFAEELRRADRSARLFYGGRSAADLVLRERLAATGLPHTLATDDGSLGERGQVTEPLERHLTTTGGRAALFACGPGPLLRAVARLAEVHDLPAHVSLDPWMGCGLGICLSCVVRIQAAGEGRGQYRCACTEGPVFDASVVVWGDERQSLARRRELQQ